jgi:hypothetical protein
MSETIAMEELSRICHVALDLAHVAAEERRYPAAAGWSTLATAAKQVLILDAHGLIDHVCEHDEGEFIDGTSQRHLTLVNEEEP